MILKENKYLTAAKKSTNWLINKMQNSDGSFLAKYDGETGKKTYNSFSFEGDRGCLHAKHAIPLLKLFNLTGEDKFKNSAIKVCNWVLKLQNKNGAFWANEHRKYIFTHAHCYATEGLLYAYYNLNSKEYLDAAVKAAEWLLNVQNKDGSFYKEFYNKQKKIRIIFRKVFPFKVTDATAQAIRIWIILYKLTGLKKYFKASKKALQFIKSMQCKESVNLGKFGSIYYQCVDFPGYRHLSPEIKSWPTMFSIQACQFLKYIEDEHLDKSIILCIF